MTAQSLPPIIHEDEAMLAFDKPPGLPVAPDRAARSRPTLIEAARARYGDALTNVHRLDTAASGVLLCARTKEALDFLSGQFQSKTVDKRYLALVAVLPADRALPVAAALRAPDGGLPETFALDFPLVDDRREPGRMRVGKGRDDEKPLLARLALHASELTLKHPVTREPITLRAPLPPEFEIALKYLRKFPAGRGIMRPRGRQHSD